MGMACRSIKNESDDQGLLDLCRLPSLNTPALASLTDMPDTRIFFSPRPYPTWTTHNTPRYCTSVNNSSNLHLYIGHMHIQFCLWTFFFLYIFTLIMLSLFALLSVCTVSFLYWKLLTPRQIPCVCVQTHLAIKLSDSDIQRMNEVSEVVQCFSHLVLFLFSYSGNKNVKKRILICLSTWKKF